MADDGWSTMAVIRGMRLLTLAAVISLAGCNAAARPPEGPPTATTLPGQRTLAGGVSSYLFGTNDTIEYGKPNVDNLPSVRQYLKDGGLTLMRSWFYKGMSDDELETRARTVQDSGMQCMGMLGTTNDVTWLEHVVTLLGPRCNIYEFSNEPNGNGYTTASYLADWNAAILRLRALNPAAKFGGPATQGAIDIQILIAFLKAAGDHSAVMPDFITFHEYPCFGRSGQRACLDATPKVFTDDITYVRGLERKYLGRTLPTGITEYNFDPGGGNLYAWGDDGAFMYQWTEVALRAFIAAHLDFANQFTTLNYSGYGKLDMFQDAAPYSPKPQFNAMVDVLRRSGSAPVPNAPSKATGG